MEGWEDRAQTRANLEAEFKRQDKCGDDAWRVQRDAKLQIECDTKMREYEEELIKEIRIDLLNISSK